MEVLYARCCGLDIEAGYRKKETRTFGTTTRELLLLRRWLIEAGCTHIGMESTGVLWRPVADRLTGFFELVLVNVQQRSQMQSIADMCSDSRTCPVEARASVCI